MANSIKVVSDFATWLRDVTKDLELKKAKIPETKDYAYELVAPAIYKLVIPPKNINGGSSAPSVTVKIKKGSINKNEAKATVIFELETWNPGKHSKDLILVKSVGNKKDSVDSKVKNPEEVNSFKKDVDGWKDILDLLETIIGKLDADEQAAGYRRTSDITYNFPFEEERAFTSTYPFQYATIQFDIEYVSIHTNRLYEEILNS